MFDALRPRVVLPAPAPAPALAAPSATRVATEVWDSSMTTIPPWMNRPRTQWGSAATVDELGALGIPAVLMALRFIGSQLGGVPLHVFDGNDVVDPAPWIVARPDPRMTQRNTLSQLAVSLAGRGNAFAVLDHRDDTGVPAVMAVVHPALVRWDVRQQLYIVGRDTNTTSATRQIAVEPGAMLHLRSGLIMPGDLFGVDPLTMCAASLGYADALAKHAQRFLVEGASFSAVIRVKREGWTPAESEDLKARVMEMTGTRQPLVIPGDHEFVSLPALTPESAELVESRKFTLIDVANVFGLNVRRVNGTPGSTQTYANAQQFAIDLWREELADYVHAIEDGFTDLLRPLGYRAKFNLSAQLRADDKSRMETHALALTNKIRTLDEVRDLEDLPPSKEANTDD